MACDGTCITQTYGGGCAELRCGVCIWITTPPGRLMDESRFLLEQLIPTSDRSEGSLGCIQKWQGERDTICYLFNSTIVLNILLSTYPCISFFFGFVVSSIMEWQRVSLYYRFLYEPFFFLSRIFACERQQKVPTPKGRMMNDAWVWVRLRGRYFLPGRVVVTLLFRLYDGRTDWLTDSILGGGTKRELLVRPPFIVAH